MSGRNARVDARPRRVERDRRGFDPDDREPARGPRISPGVVFLAMAIIGSVAYMAYTVTVRDASQIPLLASGAVVLAIVVRGPGGLQPARDLAGGRGGSRPTRAAHRARRGRRGDGRRRVRGRGDHPVPGVQRARLTPDSAIGRRRTLC